MYIISFPSFLHYFTCCITYLKYPHFIQTQLIFKKKKKQSHIIQSSSMSVVSNCCDSLSISVPTIPVGCGGHQQSGWRRQVLRGLSSFLLRGQHPYSKATVCFTAMETEEHDSRRSHPHRPLWKWRPLKLCHGLALTSFWFPQSQLPYILHD